MKKLTFILSITLTLSAFSQVPSYVPTNGLVGWWPFNGNANDESGNSLNCTIFGSVTPTDDRFGNSNSAYLWPSNGASGNYMFLPNFTSFLTNSYSISFWMLMDGGSSNPRVLSKGEWRIMTDGTSNTSRTMQFSGGYVGGLSQVNVGPVNSLEWVHVVWTVDGSSLSGESNVYFDGVLHSSQCCHDGNIDPNWTGVNPSDFNIGRKSISAFDGWGGKIDDIGIWNRALTQCEISELYYAQQFTPPVLTLSDTISACGSSTTIDAGTDPSWDTYSWNTSENSQIISVSNSGLYTVEVTDTIGCIGYDTTIVSLLQPSTSNITAINCDAYLAPDGATYSATGNYTAVIPNAVGCDSTISIDLTITNSTTGSETITECNSFTWGANNQTYTATGQYTAVLTNAVGCDSTVTLDLTIDVLSISIQPTSQTVNINTNAEFTVISSDPNATYQWQTDLGVGFQNMTNAGQYSGVTTNTLTIANTTNNNNNQQFRCIISAGACSDTSDVAVLTVNDNLGISENSEQLLKVYPNPAKETITISSDASIVGKDFSIINQLGQALILGKISQQEVSVDLSDLSTGVYVIRIDGVEKSSFRIVKE